MIGTECFQEIADGIGNFSGRAIGQKIHSGKFPVCTELTFSIPAVIAETHMNGDGCGIGIKIFQEVMLAIKNRTIVIFGYGGIFPTLDKLVKVRGQVDIACQNNQVFRQQ